MAPLAVLPIDGHRNSAYFSVQTISFNSNRSANGISGRHHDGQLEAWCIVKPPPFADCIGEVHLSASLIHLEQNLTAKFPK